MVLGPRIYYEELTADDNVDAEESRIVSENDISVKPVNLGLDEDDTEGRDVNVLKGASLPRKYLLFARKSFPVVASYFLSQGPNFIIFYFAGHSTDSTDSNTDILAGISMANLFANITFFSLIIGMGGAVDTLGSQANGDMNYREVGIILQRALAVLSLFTLPAILLWYYVDMIFLSLGVASSICNVMRSYLLIQIFAMPTSVISLAYSRYLTAMGVMDPPMYGAVVLNVLLIAGAYVLVHRLHLGYLALGWLSVGSRYVSDLSIILMSLNHPAVRRTLQPLSWEAFTKWKPFFALGVPSVTMLCAEWWAFELLTVMASQLGATAVAAQTILTQLSSLMFMLPLSIGITAGSFVGNAIGAGEPRLARELSSISLTIGALTELLLVSPVLFFLTPTIAKIMSDNPAVVSACHRTTAVLASFALADGIQAVASGVLRGAGRQTFGAITNVLSFYGLGLPSAYVLTFHTSLGVVGLMSGIAIGSIVQAASLLTYILCGCSSLFDGEAAHAAHKDIGAEQLSKGNWSATVEDEQLLLGSAVRDIPVAEEGVIELSRFVV